MSTLLGMETKMHFTVQAKSQPTLRPQSTAGSAGAVPKQVQANASMVPKASNTAAEQNNKANKQNSHQNSEGQSKSPNIVKKPFDVNNCRTCQNRRYADGSDDPGVSFKMPTSISASQSFAAVSGHESEHVSRNQAQAQAENKEVISQSVILHSAVCVECGVVYTAGGETTTVTKQKQDNQPQIDVTA